LLLEFVPSEAGDSFEGGPCSIQPLERFSQLTVIIPRPRG
jgi:hypothetical protein